MAKGKSPAFSFYPNDWLSSPRVALMTPAEEGAYIRLLCYAWMDENCSIPDDPEVVARLARLTEHPLNVCSTILERCFVKHPAIPHRLINERLWEERVKQMERSHQNALAGRKSGQVRGLMASNAVEQTLNVRSTNVEQNTNLSSSSSSSSSIFDSTSKEDTCPSDIFDALRDASSANADGASPDGNGKPRQPKWITDGFGQWWSAYPRKVGKQAAAKAWVAAVTRLVKDGRQREAAIAWLLDGCQTFARSEKGRDQQFCPHPATWLNQGRYDDDRATWEPPSRVPTKEDDANWSPYG